MITIAMNNSQLVESNRHWILFTHRKLALKHFDLHQRRYQNSRHIRMMYKHPWCIFFEFFQSWIAFCLRPKRQFHWLIQYDSTGVNFTRLDCVSNAINVYACLSGDMKKGMILQYRKMIHFDPSKIFVYLISYEYTWMLM